MAVGSITAGLITSWVIARIGRGQLLHFSSFAIAVGISMYLLGTSMWITLPGVAITTCSGSLIIQGTGAYLSNHHGRKAPTVISELHAMAAGIGIMAPLLVGAAVAAELNWRLGLVLPVAAAFVVERVRGKDVSAYGPKAQVTSESSHHDAPGSLPRKFWWTWTTVLCTAATEFALLIWGSDMLRNQGGMGAAASAASLGCIVGGLCIGRLIGARLAQRFGSENIYVGSLVLALIGFLGFWHSTNPLVLVVSLAITGLGMSMHFPLGFDRALRASGNRQDAASARLSLGAGFASGAAPFALGSLSDVYGMVDAYTIVPVALIIAIIVSVRNPVLQKDAN
ncbi:MAG: MFS transporter [Actinobacteria bacterium]|nr:MFS transporter [Actinomycetota bacterium]